MPDKHFIGLIHAVLSSAEAALGEDNSPMTRHLKRDGALAKRTAEKSLELLTMLQQKTQGNLDETERDSLYSAQKTLRDKLKQFDTN